MNQNQAVQWAVSRMMELTPKMNALRTRPSKKRRVRFNRLARKYEIAMVVKNMKLPWSSRIWL